MQTNQNKIINAPVVPTFLRFSIPNILSFLAMSSSSVVDAIYVGNYAGTQSLAAVNIIVPFFSLCFGLCIMFSSGGAVRTGKYIGEKKEAEAHAMFTKTLAVIAAIIMVVSVATFILARQASLLLGANEELVDICVSYLKIISPFYPFMILGYALSVFTRIEGKPMYASVIVISAAFINVIANGILVAILKMGVEGAAIGTAISNTYIFAMLAFPYFIGKRNLRLTRNIGKLSELFKSAYNGVSEFISEMSVGFIMFLFNQIMISRMGTNGVAAYTAINYLMFVGSIISYSTADSLISLISVNFGAKKYDRIKQFLRLALAFVTSSGFIIFLLLTLLPDMIIGLFMPDRQSEAFRIAIEFAYYMRWTFLFNGLNMVFSSYFTALHRPLESAVIAILRNLIFPSIFLSVLPRFFGNMGIFISIPLGDILTLCVTLLLYKLYHKQFKRYQKK